MSRFTIQAVILTISTIGAGPGTAMSAGAGAGAIAAEAARRPNVLFLFADDQRADTIAALGNPAIQTPNLDALARSGFVMENAYCLGGNEPAVCCPSRNMLLSGRAYFRWKGRFASADKAHFPGSLRAAGYETYHHGKRGNTALRIQERFEHNHYVNDEKDRASGEPGKTIVDAAIGFLKGRRADRPFFMYLAFSNPHDPRIAARKYLDLYNVDKVPLPRNYLPLHPFDNGEMTIRDERLAPWPRTPAEIRRHLRDYYAVITGLDHHIGRLLAALRESGEYDRTIIIYSADHGLAIGSHGLMGKQNLYEQSMKAPLIFSGPGIIRGRSDALVYLMDIYPTVCDLVGAPVPAGIDGRGFAGALQGKPFRPRKTIFLAYRDVQRALRDERWKLIRYPEINKSQLFDLRDDPDELHDLAGAPGQRPRVAKMLDQLRSWQKRLGDDAPLEVERPAPPAFVPPSAPRSTSGQSR